MALGVFTALSVFSFQDPVTQFWIQVFGAVNPLQQMLAITKLWVMDGFVEEKMQRYMLLYVSGNV